ncbi:MAG: polyribonucleotide nucleotidyltransferase [Anaerolineae bacterium]|nr:polyribonucleotide nucleotidyltransferase [Anaerolineae bacterium]
MIVEKDIAGRKITVETGRFAQQAGAAVTVRQGDTMVLATATAAQHAAPGQGFLPLTVDFEERYYAEGRIPASFFRREGRPELEATLLARLIDRPLRPLFPKYYTNETQIIVSSLAFDGQHDLTVLAMLGASTALMLSDVPFNNAVGAVRLGLIDGKFVVNPTFAELGQSSMSLVVAGTRDAVTTIEMEGHEIPEQVVVDVVAFAQPIIRELAEWQYELQQQAGKPKREFVPPKPDTTLVDRIAQEFGDALRGAINNPDKKTREHNTEQVRMQVLEKLIDPAQDNIEGQTSEILKAFDVNVREEVRRAILENNLRPDGRGAKEIRPISIEIDFLPNRVHGSALFKRGQTQVLNAVTLGGPADARKVDTMVVEAEEEFFLHHYNFPPYSTGEAAPLRQRRRDLGHGAMAQRALEPVLPDRETFPYTIRSVSEVLSSNGSSSMASCCAASLALMAAGVPIKTHVAAIGVGLVRAADSDRYVLLTDIQGIEDALGDMDFKCAGTENGITSLHLDVKTTDLTLDVLTAALEQAREGRMFILDKMNAVISQPRDYLSPFAPKLTSIQINPSKIGMVIGPGGKTVRGIQQKTGAKIDIREDGKIVIAAVTAAEATAAMDMIYDLTEEIELGRVYAGKIARIESYGVFVDMQGGANGMVHISQLADHRIEKIEDEFHIGDEVMVMVIGVDGNKVRLSRRAVLENWTLEEAQAADKGGGGGNRGRGGDRGRR